MKRPFIDYEMELVHLVSTDPNNYGTIKFTSSIGKANALVMYRVNSLSFIANFSVTTNEDYFVIESNGQSTRITFQDKGKYDLVYDLNQLLTNHSIEGYEFSINDRGQLVLTAPDQFTITDASHNAKLLLGLYHTTLPIASSRPKIISENLVQADLTMPSIPYRSYGNVLYLAARTDMICSVNNKEGNEESLSIAYKTNEILHPGFPVMCKIPAQWSIINSSQLNQLEFTLVDFQFQPVKIHSPVYLTLELDYARTNFNEILYSSNKLKKCE